jgi:hypothetical protein
MLVAPIGMPEPLKQITLFRRKQDGKWRYWGHGVFDGEHYTFWKIDRKYGWVFKRFSTYSSWNVNSLEGKVAEQMSKGYTLVALSRYMRTALNDGLTTRLLFSQMHQSRRR